MIGVGLVAIFGLARPLSAQETADVPYPALLEPSLLLSVGSIVDPTLYEKAPVILGSAREKELVGQSLTTTDILFVSRTVDGKELEPGQWVQFFRLARWIIDPHTFERLGWLLVPTGAGRVDSLTGDVAWVAVIHAYEPIQVGDYVRTVAEEDTLMVGRADRSTDVTEGYVIAFQNERAIHPPTDIVFLRLSRTDALSAGDEIAIYHPGGFQNGIELPQLAIAKAIVVRVLGQVAAAILTDTNRSDLEGGYPYRRVARTAP